MRQTFMSRGLVVMALVVSTACGTTTTPTRTHATTDAAVEVQRESMGAAEPPNAKGETLEMTRVTFPPHFRIPTHTHPGTQLAFIEHGTLTYAVVRGGDVTVHAPDGTSRRLKPGDQAQVSAGSWLVEEPGVVHYGSNKTSAKVVILTSALLKTGQPASTEVKE